MFLDDGDIFVGFLWVIDLGVGLIFFIFILHFSTFMYQKIQIEVSGKTLMFASFTLFFGILFFTFFANPNSLTYDNHLKKIWFFFLSWYDYYSIDSTQTITDLNLLREMYFYNNSLIFFIANFIVFFGVVGSALFCFLMKKIFVNLNFSQLKFVQILNKVNTAFFIRNQNFLKQQYTATGSRVWTKKVTKKTI